MWEASEGIIIILVVLFFIGILSSTGSAKPRTRSRQEFEIAGGASSTRLTAELNLGGQDAAARQAAHGVSLDSPELAMPEEKPQTPEQKSARGK